MQYLHHTDTYSGIRLLMPGYKRFVIVALIAVILFFPEYVFGTMGILLLIIILLLVVIDLVADVYIVIAVFLEKFREK
jgi:hypothetical protein